MSIILNSQPQPGKTNRYRLSIQADLNGFSFSIVNPKREEPLYLYNSPFKMDERELEPFSKEVNKLFKKSELLQSNYNSVLFYYSTPKFAAIPKEIYNREDDLANLKKLYKIGELDQIESLEVEGQEMILIYPIHATLIDSIKRYQPTTKLYPTIYPYIMGLLGSDGSEKVLFYYRERLLYIVAIKEERVLHLSSYPAHHFSTALYFLLLSIKESGMAQANTTLYVAGGINELELQRLSHYFPKVNYFRKDGHSLTNPQLQLNYPLLI